MSPKNQFTEKLPRPIDLLLEKHKARQQHIPTLINRSVSRRNFILAGAFGAAAMTMSPLERALAAYRFPGVESYLAPAGAFDFVLGIGRILAQVLGFGTELETAYGILNYFFQDRSSRDSARSGVDQAAAEIWSQREKFIGLIPLGERIVRAGQAIRTTFAAGSPQQTRLLGRPSGTFLAHTLQPPADKRFYAMALTNLHMNSLVPIFDYNDSSNRYDAKAVVGIPTLQTFNSILRNPGLLSGYTPRQLDQAVYPRRQPNNQKAYGVWEESYRVQDRFETAAGTTLEFLWEYKGDYSGNNALPNTKYGQLTTKLGGFRSGPACDKFVDTYCWVSPEAPKECPGVGDSCPET